VHLVNALAGQQVFDHQLFNFQVDVRVVDMEVAARLCVPAVATVDAAVRATQGARGVNYVLDSRIDVEVPHPQLTSRPWVSCYDSSFQADRIFTGFCSAITRRCPIGGSSRFEPHSAKFGK
jgi:hypothetical protein